MKSYPTRTQSCGQLRRHIPDDGSFSAPDSSIILPAVKHPSVKGKLILDFGDSYFLNQFIQTDGIKPAIEAVTRTLCVYDGSLS